LNDFFIFHDPIFINNEMQILKEVAYRYFKARPNCLAFYAGSSSDVPSIIFMSEKPLMETDKLQIVLVYTKKLKDFRMNAYSKVVGGKANDIANNIILSREIYSYFINSDQMVQSRNKFKLYPQFFRTVEIVGREKIFKYLTTDLKMPVIGFDRWFGPIDFSHQESDADVMKFYNARIFFPEQMRESRRKPILEVLNNVHALLTKAGLERIFHGDIRVTPINGKAIGQYSAKTKDIRVEPNTKNSSMVIYTLIHEYAHKYYYEYMSQQQQNAVKEQK